MAAQQVVLILDFGGQYKELIARRVRECNVYSIVKPGDITPDEIRAIHPIGIILTGGGSRIWGMDKLLQEHTQIPCMVADDAESCVALGCGKSLQWINSMQEGTINIARKKLMRE